MAQGFWNPTGNSDNDWVVGGVGDRTNAVTSVDGNNVNPISSGDGASRFQTWNSSEAAPADLAGSTITAVNLITNWVSAQTAAVGGTFYPYCKRAGLTAKGTGAGAASSGTTTLPRPGGGVWLPSDFTSSLYFGFKHTANATSPGTVPKVDKIQLRVTYTPLPVDPPVAEFGVSTTTGVAPLSVDFTDSSTNTPTSWAWDFGDTATATTQNPTHVYSAVGTYTVILTSTNAGGSDAETKASLVNVQTAAVDVAAQFSANPLSGVQNLGIQFYDGSTGTPTPTSWTWAFGDTSTSTEQNPFHVYTTSGTYTVTLIASNTTPSTDTETKASYISVASGLPTPTITLDTTTGSKPLTVVATGSATNADAASWSWNFGDGGTSIVQNPTHVYAEVGTYTVTLTASNAIGTASTTAGPVTVGYMAPTATFTGEPLVGYEPLTVRFRDLSTGDANAWTWNFGDTTTSTAQHPVHTYTSTGAKTVSLAVAAVASTDGGAVGGTLVNTATATNLVCVADPDNSWGLFLYELKFPLMEKLYEQNLVQGFDDFGGIGQVVKLTQQRLQKFVLQTAALRKEATLAAAAANTEDFTLPTDLIELLRVEVDGVAFYPADPYQRDRDNMINTYIVNDALTITIPGTFGTTPTVKVWYSYVPAAPATPSYACPASAYAPWGFFPLPYVLWWIVRYGVLADLFSQSGEKNDPLRAAKCEELFTQGTELYKTLYRGGA